MNLFFKELSKNIQKIPTDGYFCTDRFYVHICNSDSKNYEEEDVINKIKINSENYFDFSKNIVDIGCENGIYSFELPFNHAYMFDGNENKCIIARFNMLLHNKNCNCYSTLLSDNPDEIILFNGFESCDENSSFLVDIDNKIQLHSTTLDTYNLTNVGLIKVDVEGMEEKVLRGGIGTIVRNNYPPILFELWDVGYLGMTQEKHDSLEKFLKDLGYEILWYWGDHETHLAIHK